MKKKHSPSMGQIIGTNRVGLPILKPSKSDIARNLAKTSAYTRAAIEADRSESGTFRDR